MRPPTTTVGVVLFLLSYGVALPRDIQGQQIGAVTLTLGSSQAEVAEALGMVAAAIIGDGSRAVPIRLQ